VLTDPSGKGSIAVVNNSDAHVAATQTGAGTLSIFNNGVGGVLTATNTGTGAMTINNTATAAVTVTNTGNGNITVTASGSTAIACTFNGATDSNADHTVIANAASPNCIATPIAAGLGSNLGTQTNPNITVDGTGARTNVAAVLTGSGSITVHQNSTAHVAATQTGAGTITVTNNGQVMAATNTGTGTMNITNADTGAVAVTRTGNGNTTVVIPPSSTPLALTFNGDGNVWYPAQATAPVGGGAPSIGANLGSDLGAAESNTNITVSGSDAGDVAPALTGGGSINVVNNGTGHIAATQTGTGAINIVSAGVGAVAAGPMAATNTGDGVMTINNSDSAMVAVTNSYNGVGSRANNITVASSGTGAIACTFTDGLNHNVNVTNAAGNPTLVCGNATADVGVIPTSLGTSCNVPM
jgi:hypothetical protein